MKFAIDEINTNITNGQEEYIVQMTVRLNKDQFKQMIEHSDNFEFDLKWW